MPRRRADLVWQELDGEAVLYDPDNGFTHRMNATAVRVWEACDGKSTSLQVAGALVSQFDVTLEQAQLDVEQLIAAFARAGLFVPEAA